MNSQMERLTGQGAELLFPGRWGASPSRYMARFPAWNLSNLPMTGLLWRPPHVDMMNYSVRFQPLCPL